MPLQLSGDGAVGPLSATEIGYLDGVTSAVQAQLDGKAVVSSGTNDNGLYVRLSDGTQFCWNALGQFGALSGAVDEQTWTYPMVFATSPYVLVSEWENLTNSFAHYKVKGVTASTAVVRGLFTAPFGRANYAGCAVLAIGRWF